MNRKKFFGNFENFEIYKKMLQKQAKTWGLPI